MTRNPKVLAPFATIALALVVASVLLVVRPQAEPEIHTPPAPLVRVITAEAADVPLVVRTQGRVTPRTEIDLVAEVSGKIVEVAPSLAAGGFFTKGDVLARIDPHDYELAVERAKADVAQAEVRVAMEAAEADVARREWAALKGGSPPPLVAREPQLAEARARLTAARAMLAQATTDRDRTSITAPFDGRVRTESADLGQFVGRGTPLARIYATDVAEIRLPLPDEELAYLDLPLDYRGEAPSGDGPEAIVRGDFAGRSHEWRGRIVRIEGQIDAATHVVHAVAQVDDPYARQAGSDRPPLAAGMFVDVEIVGRRAASVFAIPRAALRGESEVLVVDAEDRLDIRPVHVLRRETERVLVDAGLAAGERVCVSPLEIAVDAMKVRVAEQGA